MASEQFANKASTFLNNGGTLSSGATSLIVSDASTFPTIGNFRILIESEILLVTAVSSNTFTVSRGIEETSAVSHADTLPVTHVLTKGSMFQFLADMNLRDVFTNRPAAGVPGRKFFCTDLPFWYYDDGTNWQKYFGSYPLVTPSNSGYSWDNQETVTIATTNDMLTLAGGSGDNPSIRYKTQPSTPYVIDVAFLVNQKVSDPNYFMYFGFRDSGGKLFVWALNVSGGLLNVTLAQFASSTATPSTYNSDAGTLASVTGVQFFRIANDGTNLTFSMSNDGINWAEWDSQAVAGFLTPNAIAWGYAGDANSSLSLIHWRQS